MSTRDATVLAEPGSAAPLLALVPPLDAPPLAIRTLGGFAVIRDGDTVPLGEWRSRKARELLKILVGARGRPVTRDYAMEALWPGQDPVLLGNRLSVALSLLRGVLDPDKRFGAQHFVRGDHSTLALELAHVDVDVQEFLDRADDAIERAHREWSDDLRERLFDAASLYRGDFLEEDAYADWAAPLREEARAAYIALARVLAEREAADGRNDAACRFLRRILERDPYDERAHLGVVSALGAARQHGEARRAYSAYCARMGEIGIETAPFPRPAGAVAIAFDVGS